MYRVDPAEICYTYVNPTVPIFGWSLLLHILLVSICWLVHVGGRLDVSGEWHCPTQHQILLPCVPCKYVVNIYNGLVNIEGVVPVISVYCLSRTTRCTFGEG